MSEGMDPFELVDLGRTGLKVTRLGLGGAPLGNPPPILSDREAVETVRRALSLGMRYVDTAAYGEGTQRTSLRRGPRGLLKGQLCHFNQGGCTAEAGRRP